MFKINVIENKSSRKVKRIEIKSFDDIKTNKLKDESPLWTFKDQSEPYETHGLVFDIDNHHFNLNELNKKISYIYHRTHSGNHRVIVPFSKPYALDRHKYKECFESAMTDLNITRALVDYRYSTNGSNWSYYIPNDSKLIVNNGEAYAPIV